ncbi:MAG: DUF4105 domain-containing protein [Myxococcota bacterium]
MTGLLLAAAAMAAPFSDLDDCPLDEPPRDDIELYVVTVSPGSQPFSFVGHAGLWVRDPARRIDHMLEFGAINSSVQEPLSALLMGTLACSWRVDMMNRQQRIWTKTERQAVAQKLDLPDDALRPFVEEVYAAADSRRETTAIFHWKERSCATEIRDILDRALSGQIEAQLSAVAPLTPRQEILRHLGPHWWAWVGWHHQAGASVDRPQTRYDAAFAPIRLAEGLVDVQVQHPDGPRSLISETCRLAEGRHRWPAEGPPQRIGWMTLIGVVFGGSVVALGQAGRHRAVAIAAILIGVIGGVLGTANVVLAAVSALDAYGPNRNWFVTSPLTLALIACGVAWWSGRRPRWAAIAAATLAILSLLGVLIAPVPVVVQQNLDFLGLMVPILAALAWVGRRGDPAFS